MQGTQQPVRVLPADVYDALELSAEAYDGIGYGNLTRLGIPCCIRGHAIVLDGSVLGGGPVNSAISAAFPSGITGLNDAAVLARVGRHGRITFQQWAKDLNVVRGE